MMANLTLDFPSEIETLSKAFQLSVREDTYYPESFGNAILILSGPGIRIRLCRDRDQFLLDLAPIGNYRWASVNEVFESLRIPYQLDPNSPPTGAVQMLVDRREQVLDYIQEQKASWPAPRIRPPL